MINWIEIPLEAQIPETLVLRDNTFNYLIGVSLFAGILFLAFARARQANIYTALVSGLFKTANVRSFLRDTMPMDRRSSFLLLFNYLISFGLIVFLWAERMDGSQIQNWLLAALVPSGILAMHLGSMIITGWITGEKDIFRAPLVMKLLGAQFLGIVYFICALIWVLQPDYVPVTIMVILVAFLLENLFRIVKSISVVLGRRVSWYYIILYFCTLEILPFVVGYYYFTQDLRG